MNRLLNKKKSREAMTSSNAAVSTPSPPPPLPLDSKSAKKGGWGWKKQNADEKPPALDLTAALPANDNFRTSLLMPGLSARFSMLKDQDDPGSVLGKASDDSVLHSRKRSRQLNGAAFGLGDIAEDASVKSSAKSSVREIRPPFAVEGRSPSYNSGYGTDEDSKDGGSIMSRARPGEGNVLFGGRQKIYKIPVGDSGAVKNLGETEGRGMRGRALYEDDVIMSDFQKYRQREKQQQQQQQQFERQRQASVTDNEQETEAGAKDDVRSPSQSLYDEKRDTTSSTTSGPSMMSASTAATSVVNSVPSSSPVIPPSREKNAAAPQLGRSNSRRLYENGIEQHLNEKSSATLTRMNSVQRKGLAASKSTPNLQDKSNSSTPESSRAASPFPPPSAEKLTTFESIREKFNNNPSPSPALISPPGVSPVTFQRPEREDLLSQALPGSERGKATALGQFNRPKKFDEEQYLARQRSLHQQQTQRSLRPLKANQSPNKGNSARSSEDSTRFGGFPRPSGERRSRAPTLQSDRSGSALPSIRNVSTANSSKATTPVALSVNTSRKPSLAGPESPPRVFEDPARPRPEDLLSEPVDSIAPAKISFERGTTADVPAPLRSPPQSSPRSSVPSMEKHPALRKDSERSSRVEETTMSADALEKSLLPTLEPTSEIKKPDPVERQDTGLDPNPNPTLLGGMIKRHLRTVSNTSSIYPTSPSRSTHRSGGDFDNRVPSMYGGQGTPWDDDYQGPGKFNIGGPDGDDSIPPVPPVPQISATSQPDFSKPLAQGGPTAKDAADWIFQLKKQHGREPSNETKQERIAWNEQLATRKSVIQQNLQARERAAERSPSPNANKDRAGLTPFNKLRNRISGEGLYNKQENISSRSLGRNGKPVPPNIDIKRTEIEYRSGFSPSVSPMGRTLHMKMSDDEPSEDSHPSSSGPRSRQFPASPQALNHDENPLERRTTAKRDQVDSMYEPVGSNELTRNEFAGAETLARPSVDDGYRSRSGTGPGNAPPAVPVPPIPTHLLNSSRPGALSAATRTITDPIRPAGVSEGAISPPALPPAPHSTYFPPDAPPAILNVQTPLQRPDANHVGHAAALKNRQQLPDSSGSNNSSTSNRSGSHWTGFGRRAGRSPTVNKTDISEPTLISSTHQIDMIDLPSNANAQLVANRDSDTLSPTSICANNDRKASDSSLGAKHSSGARRFIPPFGRRDSPSGNSSDRTGASSPAFSLSSRKDNASSLTRPSGDTNRSKDTEEEDDFVNRPSGGRLRIRKISDANPSNGGRRGRHEAVWAEIVEGRDGVEGSGRGRGRGDSINSQGLGGPSFQQQTTAAGIGEAQ